jgi:hypothetical protein
MSDIVSWLEHIADYDTPQDPREGCRKAALEIKRLRAALREIARLPYSEERDNTAQDLAREVLGDE